MADPECFPDGTIMYVCPLGCKWYFTMQTPVVQDLDKHVQLSRETLSRHYIKTHGIVVEG